MHTFSVGGVIGLLFFAVRVLGSDEQQPTTICMCGLVIRNAVLKRTITAYLFLVDLNPSVSGIVSTVEILQDLCAVRSNVSLFAFGNSPANVS